MRKESTDVSMLSLLPVTIWIFLVPGGHGLSHGISWIRRSVGSLKLFWVRVTTAWFGSFSQSAVHFDQSVHLVNAPVMVCFLIDIKKINFWITFAWFTHTGLIPKSQGVISLKAGAGFVRMSRSAGSFLENFSLAAGLRADAGLLPDAKHERLL